MQAKLIKSAVSAIIALGVPPVLPDVPAPARPPAHRARRRPRASKLLMKMTTLAVASPTKTTDRYVKSTAPDKADEPVRSIGNTVGIKGNSSAAGRGTPAPRLISTPASACFRGKNALKAAPMLEFFHCRRDRLSLACVWRRQKRAQRESARSCG